jgi:2-dehydropantoate 2-reductase
VKPRALRRTAACRLFPSGEVLPSTISAGSCLPLFDRFLGTTTSSDFSPPYMLGVRLLPSRAGPAQGRARVRPPRFRRQAVLRRDDIRTVCLAAREEATAVARADGADLAVDEAQRTLSTLLT